MPFYEIYVTMADGAPVPLLMAEASDKASAISAANALMNGHRIPVTERAKSQEGIPGIVTGRPVWARNFDDERPVILVTEHGSAEQAQAAREEVLSALSRAASLRHAGNTGNIGITEPAEEEEE
jgi:hypothetical protein